ncbi:MAG: DUF2924 domain-containing protein [Paracoccaceae bacterium]
MTDRTRESVAARVAALREAPLAELREEWRALFGAEAPITSRDYLRRRLAYRVQELAFGGLKPATVKRLEEMGERLDGGNVITRRIRADLKPVAGTRLVREWQGVEHVVTVTADGYEWEGRSYRSISAVARAITGTRWNGWTFFGLKGRGAGA